MDYSHVKRGCAILFKGEFPCKVGDVQVSAPGKHGHAKKACVGEDLFTGKKHQEIFTHHSRIVPVATERIVYSVVLVDEDGYLDLMNEHGVIRSDLNVSQGMSVKEGDDLTVLRVSWEDTVREEIHN